MPTFVIYRVPEIKCNYLHELQPGETVASFLKQEKMELINELGIGAILSFKVVTGTRQKALKVMQDFV